MNIFKNLTKLIGISLVLIPTMSLSKEINQYEHMIPEGRMKLNKYRAARYVLPKKSKEAGTAKVPSQFRGITGGGNGISIGNVLPGAKVPREINVIIDGDVINYCLNCNSRSR